MAHNTTVWHKDFIILHLWINHNTAEDDILGLAGVCVRVYVCEKKKKVQSQLFFPRLFWEK